MLAAPNDIEDSDRYGLFDDICTIIFHRIASMMSSIATYISDKCLNSETKML